MSLLDKASLVQIPSGYKATKLYSVVPDSGAGDFTFSRSSSATRVNSEGLIEEMSANVPRLDYSDGSCASLLLEPQSTNLVTQSETFSNWNTEGGKQVVTQGVLISPDGTLNGNKLETYNTASSNPRKLWIASSVTVGASYTFSVYIKQVSGQINSGFLHITTGANDTFDVSQAYTATDQWQRVSVTTNSAASSQIRFLITGDANSQIYIWGAQVEQQSYPTSYIPTSGSTVTRTADVCDNAGTSATFNDAEGVLFAEIAALSDDQTSRGIAIDGDGSTENRVIIQYQPSFSNQIRALLKNNDNSSVELTYVLSDITDYAKIAFKYKSGDLALWVNGVERDTSSDIIFLSNLQELSFDNGRGSNNFFGKCKQLIYFNEALSDAELTALTTL